MIKTLILEDEIYIQKALISFIEILKYPVNIVGKCESVAEGIRLTKLLKPELIFLDIHLSDGHVLEFLQQTKDENFQIIFLTSDPSFAVNAFKYKALDYLLKPIDIDDLDRALSRTNISKPKTNVKTTQSSIIIPLQNELQFIELSELVYCKSDKGYTTFHLENGTEYMASKPLKHFITDLPSDIFFRTHQSYIINITQIDRYDKSGFIILKNKKMIPVSQRKKEEFLSLIMRK